jgi:hypothetical protein
MPRTVNPKKIYHPKDGGGRLSGRDDDYGRGRQPFKKPQKKRGRDDRRF